MFALPVLIPGFDRHTWLTPEGEVLLLDGRETSLRLKDGQAPALVCHGAAAARRLHTDASQFADILSLFAFVRPARWCVPTPCGLAEALGLPPPIQGEDQALILLEAQRLLIDELAARWTKTDRDTLDQLGLARAAGWAFAEPCLRALDGSALEKGQGSATCLQVWRSLPKWEDAAPPGRSGNAPLTSAEAEDVLTRVLTQTGNEDRPEQRAYARAVVPAFAPAHDQDAPALVLAEAGTGVGKTLGYLAPAVAWRQKNLGPVWLSTYTRNLQRQLDQELDRLYPNSTVKERRVVVRKGRENYLCLLNMEEQINAATPGLGAQTLGLILLARWAKVSRAGELIGGDCPGWLRELVGARLAQDLAVRRGECWHGACPHYGVCFAERVARKAPHAEIVVANHAFVITQALSGLYDMTQEGRPTHFVFDEGHHLFDAADNAFAICLSGLETRDLRRWILGAERAGPSALGSRARGLRKRLEDLVTADRDLNEALHRVERAAHALPAQGWYRRLKAGTPQGPVETFLAALAAQVYARSAAADRTHGFSLEVAVQPVTEAVAAAAGPLGTALAALLKPLNALGNALAKQLEDLDEAGENAAPEAPLSSDQRRRLGGVANALRQRALDPLGAFKTMVSSLSAGTPEGFVDWFEVTRIDGQDVDVAFFRKFIDPTHPFMNVLARQAQGALITSATLTDQTGVAEVDWSAAEALTGTAHALSAPVRLSLRSPYAYSDQARVFVVTDLDRKKPRQAAAAMAQLFLKAGGGGLGLFTSIQRLRTAYAHIAPKLEARGLSLLAQHVDAMDVTTLIDIFRQETATCLLGTDALRDGVDVPGQALRLLVFDRVPWPRPTLAHRARRAHFGPRSYDDRLTRLRLRQAFGRLIRHRQDRGAFVLLDSRLPSRLESAFPEQVSVMRLPLKDVLATLRDFYQEDDV